MINITCSFLASMVLDLITTEFAALELVDRTIMALDKGDTPVNIFIDLSKAFDTLDHNILLNKLRYYLIKDTSLALFKSYLANRQQYVFVNDTKSDLLDINTGVP